jgi:transcriptional regulator with XRE-family HTH domain
MSNLMKSPGNQLREAREQLGKSQSDMAKQTRISIQQLQGLEADRYESIPAPMYVRGFMKLYAKTLGLNPDPLVAMYERIRTGEPLEEPPQVPKPAPETLVEENFSPKPLSRIHPEFSVEQDLSTPSPKTIDWQAWMQKVPRLQDFLNPEWFRSSKVRYALMGIAALCLLLILRSCVKGSETSSDELPVIEETLLRPPEPVYFQLPSSYQ